LKQGPRKTITSPTGLTNSSPLGKNKWVLKHDERNEIPVEIPSWKWPTEDTFASPHYNILAPLWFQLQLLWIVCVSSKALCLKLVLSPVLCLRTLPGSESCPVFQEGGDTQPMGGETGGYSGCFFGKLPLTAPSSFVSWTANISERLSSTLILSGSWNGEKAVFSILNMFTYFPVLNCYQLEN
jgi:hypothetical protein